jgi:hypothetical protein
MSDSARQPKDDGTPPQPPSAPPEKVEKEKATATFYSNSFSIVVGLYDFTLLFAHRIGETETSRNVAVVMSPQHVAAVAIVLEKYLNAYEEQFGKINLPNDLLAQLKAKLEKVEESHA